MVIFGAAPAPSPQPAATVATMPAVASSAVPTRGARIPLRGTLVRAVRERAFTSTSGSCWCCAAPLGPSPGEAPA
ncbi:hypothetical protein GCM10009735_12770 [Actinomadura chokoriensis]